MHSPVELSSGHACDGGMLQLQMPMRYSLLSSPRDLLTLRLFYIKSIELEPSIIGYIAKSVALVANGEKHKAYRACDIAFEYLHSSHICFFLLVKVCIPYTTWLSSTAHMAHWQAIVVAMAGEYDDAISRIDDLMRTVQLDSICYVVQACAYHTTTQRTSPLTYLTGIYSSSPRKLAHGEW